MKHDSKRDANELNIVRGLEAFGCSVERLSQGGVPDLLVGYKKTVCLIEVKMPSKKLNAVQVAWHSNWRGQVAVVTTLEQAIDVVMSVFRATVPF